jgi:hypothetical protein
MPMSLDLEIRDWLARYLAGDISLRAFRDWFMPATWNVHQTGNVEAIDLTGEIGLRIAELTSGHRTELDVRFLLLPLVQRYTVYHEQDRFDSASKTIRSVMGSLPMRFAGRRSEAASV